MSSVRLECAGQLRRSAARFQEKGMIPGRTSMKFAILLVVLIPALGVQAQSPAAQPTSAAKTISTTGIPYLPDSDQAGPPELLQAIRARRPNGKLLNLDRMLLHSPEYATAWNTMF